MVKWLYKRLKRRNSAKYAQRAKEIIRAFREAYNPELKKYDSFDGWFNFCFGNNGFHRYGWERLNELDKWFHEKYVPIWCKNRQEWVDKTTLEFDPIIFAKRILNAERHNLAAFEIMQLIVECGAHEEIGWYLIDREEKEELPDYIKVVTLTMFNPNTTSRFRDGKANVSMFFTEYKAEINYDRRY